MNDRQRVSQTNKALLQSLGLDIPTIPQKQKPAPKTASSKPKKRKSVTEDNNESSRPTKMAKSASATDELDASEGSRRRSLRNAAKPRLSYSESLSNSAVMSENIAKAKGPQVVSEAAMKFGREVDGNRIGKRKHDPYVFEMSLILLLNISLGKRSERSLGLLSGRGGRPGAPFSLIPNYLRHFNVMIGWRAARMPFMRPLYLESLDP